MSELNTVGQMLHAERSAKNTTRVDCWACESAQSPTIQELIHTLAAVHRLAEEWRQAARVTTRGDGAAHADVAHAAKRLGDTLSGGGVPPHE